MGNVLLVLLFLFCFVFCCFLFVGKLDDVVLFSYMGDSSFLASFGILATFPINMFVFYIFSKFCENTCKDMIRYYI